MSAKPASIRTVTERTRYATFTLADLIAAAGFDPTRTTAVAKTENELTPYFDVIELCEQSVPTIEEESA